MRVGVIFLVVAPLLAVAHGELWQQVRRLWDDFCVIPSLTQDARTEADWTAFTASVLTYLNRHPRRDLRRPETRREMILAGKEGVLRYRQRKLCRERNLHCPSFDESYDD